MGKKIKSSLIKGYLPVRIKLSSVDETFFFVKEHHSLKSADNARTTTMGKRGTTTDTLFVVNAPTVPPIPSNTLLMSILGRYGNVSQVTLVNNPRESNHHAQHDHNRINSAWTDKFAPPSFLLPTLSTTPNFSSSNTMGKFAHIVFESPREVKKVMRALADIMSSDSSDDVPPGIVLDKNDLVALTPPQCDMSNNSSSSIQCPVWTCAQRYLQSFRDLASTASRNALLEECNQVMREYEQETAKAESARQVASSEPDDEGFITVSFSNNRASSKSTVAPKGSSKHTLDAASTNGHHLPRKSGQKRKRNKKSPGASNLKDFYRFQTKIERRRNLQELRQSFEEDLAKIQKMKEQSGGMPFGNTQVFKNSCTST